MASPSGVSPDVLITIKLQIGTENRRFKLPLRDLGANTFPGKLRSLLALPPNKRVTFERYSDSAGTFITLDSANASVYKQLYRAAKAKLKLRIKATVTDIESPVLQAPRDNLSTPNVQLPSISSMPPVSRSVSEKSELQTAVEKVMALSTANPQQPAEEFAHGAYAQYVRNCMAAQVRDLNTASTHAFVPPPVKAPMAEEKGAEDEAPVPKPFGEEQLKRSSTLLAQEPMIRLRAVDQDFPVPSAAFTVCCNSCELTIPDAHWHCSICHNGDYDLCQDCVNRGIHCGVEGHFLIKRLIEGGKVITSTTETVPKKMVAPTIDEPLTTSDEAEPEPESEPIQTRTCNCCVKVFEESEFVTCKDCDDYDLCIPCHVSLKHGHNPAHEFAPVDEEIHMEAKASLMCKPGRHVAHHAICDGCNKYLYGVRHKCLKCPDWDYCNNCVKNAKTTHPGHGFVAVHEPLSIPRAREQVHHGINCDGPLCAAAKTHYWIVGDRYKCTVCHDTDFCARCEALPTHRHNRTHPLIKFRTPVRSVTVTTLGEKENGEVMSTMGDRLPETSSKATETIPAATAVNAATQVQTVAEVKPVELVKPVVKDEPIVDEKAVKVEDSKPVPTTPTMVKTEPKSEPKSEPSSPRTEKPILQAHFLCDATPDGSKIKLGSTFQQVWVLRNPGPHEWPAGCSVRYVGGDNMLNVDNKHPSSVGDIACATESNVINHPVAKDEEVAFWVTMKAPERVGKAISYWRLKSPDAIPFGHRLWCDIDVYAVEPEVEEVGTSEHIEDIDAEQEAPAPVKEDKASESQMIFPKLDKESPVSSTYHEAVSSNAATTPAAVNNAEEHGLLDDAESLTMEDADSTDDGFLTDDDYEILDMEGEGEAVNGKK